jgi:hypothetical protein
MDSNQFEKERGITIASKYTSFQVGRALGKAGGNCWAVASAFAGRVLGLQIILLAAGEAWHGSEAHIRTVTQAAQQGSAPLHSCGSPEAASIAACAPVVQEQQCSASWPRTRRSHAVPRSHLQRRGHAGPRRLWWGGGAVSGVHRGQGA